MLKIFISIFFCAILVSCANNTIKTNNSISKSIIYMKSLNEEEKRVILNKGTEKPFTGEYENHFEKGTYLCKQCKSPLYKSESKFHSDCGWPSFDDEIPGSVKRIPDKDGMRTEIICSNCNGHLGHVFEGEGYTSKNIRHCVNSVSMIFTTESLEDLSNNETAIFAGGCFWGVEHLMKDVPGVKSVVSGYIGGHLDYPTYKDVCTGNTGHAEAVRITYNPNLVKYETLAKLFFEIHDPEQVDGQGPDLGNQYRSEIFYLNAEQKEIADSLISVLKAKGYKIATAITRATTFWEAEEYHQDYYERKGTLPYCHSYTKRF